MPVFAVCSAGVAVGGLSGLGSTLTDRVAVGIVVGLVVGKPIGVLAATYLVARTTRTTLDEGLAWVDVVGLALLTGIGFTVCLLIGELASGAGSHRNDHVKVAVVAGSLLAALLLRLRNRSYHRIHQAETTDRDHDGVRAATRTWLDQRRTVGRPD